MASKRHFNADFLFVFLASLGAFFSSNVLAQLDIHFRSISLLNLVQDFSKYYV